MHAHENTHRQRNAKHIHIYSNTYTHICIIIYFIKCRLQELYLHTHAHTRTHTVHNYKRNLSDATKTHIQTHTGTHTHAHTRACMNNPGTSACLSINVSFISYLLIFPDPLSLGVSAPFTFILSVILCFPFCFLSPNLTSFALQSLS